MVSSISAVVGGIVIMNVMLVSVTQRTREIGLRRAMGATKADILRQFLAESLLQCLIGGAIGIVIGFGCALARANVDFVPGVGEDVGRAAGRGAQFDHRTCSSASIRRAKRPALDPVTALRTETG